MSYLFHCHAVVQVEEMMAVLPIDGSVLILAPLCERQHFIELFITNMWGSCLFSFRLE